MTYDADAIAVGAGRAGLVATAELANAGRRVILLDQESEQSFGGQAFWSFGGLFLVDSPEQRWMRIRDSYELALQDWLGKAGFDDPADHWARQWAEAYVRSVAAGEFVNAAAPSWRRRLQCKLPVTPPGAGTIPALDPPFKGAPGTGSHAMTHEEIAEDVASVSRLETVRVALKVLRRTTGLRIALVARVTDHSWTACAVLDEADFGLKPGDELVLSTTF